MRSAPRQPRGCPDLVLVLLAPLASCSWNFSSPPVEPPDALSDPDAFEETRDTPDAAEDSGDDGAGEEPPAEIEEGEDEGEGESEDAPAEDAECQDCAPDVPNAPPTVSVTAPADGELIHAGTATDVRAEASDSDGIVQDIRIYLDGDLVAEDEAASLVWTWSSPVVGHHQLSAWAEDNLGASDGSGDVEAVVFEVARFQDGAAPDEDYAGTADTT